jgi:hypothetical protein
MTTSLVVCEPSSLGESCPNNRGKTLRLRVVFVRCFHATDLNSLWLVELLDDRQELTQDLPLHHCPCYFTPPGGALWTRQLLLEGEHVVPL